MDKRKLRVGDVVIGEYGFWVVTARARTGSCLAAPLSCVKKRSNWGTMGVVTKQEVNENDILFNLCENKWANFGDEDLTERLVVRATEEKKERP